MSPCRILPKVILQLLVVAALAAVVLPVASPGPASAQENDAIAVNEKDGKSVFKLAFQVKKTMDSDVDATNTAIAYASCTDCRTVAAAIQVVLVMEDPDSVNVENSALAINYDCTECETMAAAYQFVFGTGEELAFTKEGKRRLQELRKQFYDLKKRDDLTLQQLNGEIAIIAGAVAEVVDSEVVAKKDEDDGAAESGTTVSTTTSTTVNGARDDTTATTANPTESTASPTTVP